MSLAPERLGIGISRHFTTPGVHPYDEVVWERRDARITQLEGRHRSPSSSSMSSSPSTWSLNATNIVAQKYFRGTLGTPERESSLRQVDRPRRRHHHHVGHRGRLLRRRRRGRGVPRRAEVHPRHPAGRVQHAGVVQHRREGRAAAGQRLLHPVGRRQDGLDPQLVPRRGHHLQGRLRLGHQPVQDPLQPRAAQGRRHRQRARSASCAAPTRRPAPSSRAARPAAPPRWSSSTSTTPTSRSSSGARPRRSARPACCATPASTWTSTAATRSRSSTRTPTTRCASPTSSCRPSSTTPTGTSRPSPPARPSRRSGPATCGARSPRRRGSAPTRACSSTPRSTSGTPRTPRAASTARTRAASTCTSTTRRATSPRINLLQVPRRRRHASTSRRTSTPSRSCSPRRRSSSAAPTTRPSRSARPAASSASSASATPTSAPCSWRSACPTTRDEGRAWAAALTSLMTGHAYATSARTASRMGPFAGFAENEEHMLNVLRMHRDAAYADRRHDVVPADLLAAGQRGVGRRRARRRGVRRAQQPGHRCSRPPAPSA